MFLVLTWFPERFKVFRFGAFCTILDISSSLYSLLLLKFKDNSCEQNKVHKYYHTQSKGNSGPSPYPVYPTLLYLRNVLFNDPQGDHHTVSAV